MKSFDNLKVKKSQKSPNDYNFPFQNNSMYYSLTKFSPSLSKSRIEEGGRRSIMFEDNARDENTSRSGSIQGRKLSFCDHHLTVSQNTIEPSAVPINQGSNILFQINAVSYREQESNQNYLNNANNGRKVYQSFIGHSSINESSNKIKPVSSLGEISHLHGQIRGSNPRQSKEASKKHKKRQPQLNNVNKIQQAVRQHIKSQQSIRNNSRSPLREKRDTYPYGNMNENRSQHKSNSKVKQASFLLTFNRDKDDTSPHRVSTKSKKSSKGKENQKVIVSYEGGILSIDNKEIQVRQEEENRLRKSLINHSSAKKKKKKTQDKKYQSPSPQNKVSTPYQHFTNKYSQNKYSDHHSNIKSNPVSPDKEHISPNRKSIDKLVKDNLKKQIEKEKKQLEEVQIRKEQESQRRKNIDSQNKKIRQENLKKIIQIKKSKIQSVQKTIDIEEKPPKFVILNERKSPLKIIHQKNKESFNKNKDMPMKVDLRRKKEQLGLEIFDIKKELGMKQNLSTVEPHSQRQKSKTPKPSDLLTEEFAKHKVIQPNPKLQKLIFQQQKERVKKEKKQKMKDWKKQIKIIENLKNLNKQITEQQKSFKKKPMQQRSQPNYFKTAQEDLEQFKIEAEQKRSLDRSRSNERQAINIEIPLKKRSPIKQVKTQTVSARRQTMPAKQKDYMLPRQMPQADQKIPKNKVLYSHISSQHHNSQHHQSISQQRKVSNHNSHSSLGKPKKNQGTKKKIIDVLIEQMQQKAESINQSHISKQKKSKKNKSSSRVQNHHKLIDSPQTKFLYNNQQAIVAQTPTIPSFNQPKEQIQKSVQKQNDNIVIQDDLIIFFLMNAAAQVIQRNFREYLQRKKLNENRVMFIQNAKDDKTLTFQKVSTPQETPSLNNSALLEKRLKPVQQELQYFNHQQIPQQVQPTQKAQKKQAQHTFSFGDIDKSHIQKMPIEKQVFEMQENRVQPQQNYQKSQRNQEEHKEQRPIQKKEVDKFQALRNVAQKQKGINNLYEIKKQLDTISKENTQKEQRVISVIENSKRQSKQNKQEEIVAQPPPVKQQSSKQSIQVLDQDVFDNDYEEYKNFLMEKENEEKKIESKMSSLGKQSRKKDSKEELMQKLHDLSNFSLEIENDNDFSGPQQDDSEKLEDQFNNESRVSISIDEQTDKLIGQSPMNTNEELLERAVNQSNNFIEDSLNINDSNLLSGKIDDYQSHLQQVISSEKSFKHQRSNLFDQSKDQEAFRVFKSENESQSIEGQGRNSLPSRAESLQQQKPFLRLMFGDEKFLLEQNNQAYPFSLEGSHMGSAPSSHRQYQQSENAYFLATNASIFDRNPFKEFTTNRLQDVLAGKEFKEIIEIKEDALKFQEKIEKGMINRMEKKLELSPKSVQRRKYEFESWVTSERAENEKKKQRDQPINISDLEQERQEAMRIIEQANKKAKEYKDILSKKQKNVINVESHSYPGDEHSISKIDISQEIEIIDQQEKQIEEKAFSRMPELVDEEKIDSFHEKKDTENEKINLSLDISFEEEDSFIGKEPVKKDSSKSLKDVDIDELTQQIFREFIQKEALNLIPKRHQDQIVEQIQIKEEKNDEPKFPQIQERFIQEKQPLIKISPLVDSNPVVSENTQTMSKQAEGIDTSEQAIDEYIEEIFTQIRARSSDFMNAFSTPILRDPLDMLGQIQKPEFGEGDQSLDLTNSLTCILNVQLYLTLEKARENLIHEAIMQIKKQSIQSDGGQQYTDDEFIDLITESQHIHNKVIFDSINEALNLVRPYQNQGLPMPWSRKSRKKLDIYKSKQELQLNIILTNVKQMILGWAKTRAGAIPYHNQGGNEEENFSQLREKGLAQLLSQDLLEGEKKWLDYEVEETQVKIDMSDIILEHLIGEVCIILNEIQDKRGQQ